MVKYASRIDNKDRWDIPEEIDDEYPGTTLGTAFMISGTSNKNALEIIAEKFGLTNNEDGLIKKILEIHAVLSAKYPNVSPASATPAEPAAPETPPTPSTTDSGDSTIPDFSDIRLFRKK